MSMAVSIPYLNTGGAREGPGQPAPERGLAAQAPAVVGDMAAKVRPDAHRRQVRRRLRYLVPIYVVMAYIVMVYVVITHRRQVRRRLPFFCFFVCKRRINSCACLANINEHERVSNECLPIVYKRSRTSAEYFRIFVSIDAISCEHVCECLYEDLHGPRMSINMYECLRMLTNTHEYR